MTYLAVPIFGRSIDALRRDRGAAIEAGADLLELRVDLTEGVSNEDLHALRETAGAPTILTIRSAAEGGQWDRDDDDRLGRLIELGPMADYIDVELATWQRSANVRHKVGLALKRAAHVSQADGQEDISHPGKRKLILSRHDLQTRPPRLQADFLAMVAESSCSVPKLAWRARTIRDNFEAFELMRQSPRPAIIICMGELGLPSRVLAPKFGAFATFASLAAEVETAPGQLTIRQMKDLYRWDTIDQDTQVYGVIGNPVGHSLGPRLHNATFAAVGENAVYLPLPVCPGYEPFKAFLTEVRARPWLDFRGFSVTLPHKENALRFLREVGGMVAPLAERIGAVNTLILDGGGGLAGYNTDCRAAMTAIVEGVRKARNQGAAGIVGGMGEGDPRLLAGLRVAVLGAGGVARAIVAGLVEAGAEVTIYNRTAATGTALAQAFGCRAGLWSDRGEITADLLVNCTSVGMSPAPEDSPIPASALSPGMAVFDVVYTPRRTKLLREAAERGCATIEGVDFFILQALAQFELWTGREMPVAAFRRIVERHIDAGPK